MLTNGDAFQDNSPALFRDGDQAEIGGAAAHVAHEDKIANFDSASPRFTLTFQPGVKSSLRLFQQRDLLIACLFRGAPGQFACFFIEGGRYSKQHILLGKRETFRVAAVPNMAKILQELRRCL